MRKNVNVLSLLICFQLLFLQGCAYGNLGGIYGEEAEIETTEQEETKASEAKVENIVSADEMMTVEQEADGEEGKKETFDNCYYYEQLSENQKEIYRQVYRSLLQRNEVAVGTLSPEELDKIYTCVLNDHPEIFYTDSYMCVSHSIDDTLVKLSFEGQYIYDEEECEDRLLRIEEEAGRILEGIPEDSGDFEKIKYIFDVLVNETEYNMDAEDNQNICSVFLGHESTCQGYAKATQYLLNKAGIYTTLVSGNVSGGSHAWNLVMSDGAWYYLDTTWGDVDYQSQQGETVEKTVMPINYDYFLINSDRLYETHTPGKLVAFPDCVATADNYYVHEGLYLTGLDTEVLHGIFQRAYERGDTVVQFQCSNDAVFKQVADYLLEEQHIFDFVDTLDAVPYYDNPETDTFCFWL